MTRQTIKSRILGKRRPPKDPVDVEFPVEAADDDYVAACLNGLRPARDVLPTVALSEALGPAGLRRLKGANGIAVVVEVPSADWIPGIELALQSLSDFAYICCRSGASRTQDKTTEGNERVGRLLSDGARVAGVSQSPSRFLPATLVASADLYVRIGPISNRSIARIVREATGKRPRKLPRAVASALDFDTATAAVRLGGTPRDAVRRLQAATTAQGGADQLLADAPALVELSGYGPAMQWSLDLVRDLDAWREGQLDWQAISRTCLWASEPGLGKTTLARALAKAARIPLVSASVGEWFTGSDGYLGGVLRAAEQTLQRAASLAPALLFLDECDSIPNRAAMDDRGRDWWTPVCNYILTELDTNTSKTTSKLIVVGATNNAQNLDPALVRPGRLHPTIRIPRPDAASLAGIFRTHLREDLAGEDLTGIAHLAVGGTGADVTAWVKQARATARNAGRRISAADLALAVAPPDDRTEGELRIVALHEAAHAAASVLLDVATVRSVSIAMGRSSAGATQATLHPRGILTRRQFEAIAVVALAGRAMDTLSGEPHSGAGGSAGSDLAHATSVLASMHLSHGLGDTLLFRGDPKDAAKALASDVGLRRVVERDLQRLLAQALALVRENRILIEAIAERLLARRVLPGDEVTRLVQERGRPVRLPIAGGCDAR